MTSDFTVPVLEDIDIPRLSLATLAPDESMEMTEPAEPLLDIERSLNPLDDDPADLLPLESEDKESARRAVSRLCTLVPLLPPLEFVDRSGTLDAKEGFDCMVITEGRSDQTPEGSSEGLNPLSFHTRYSSPNPLLP